MFIGYKFGQKILKIKINMICRKKLKNIKKLCTKGTCF